MIISIKEITRENWLTACRLKVRIEQECFVALNVLSIAQSKFDTFLECYGIYSGEEMVGFTAIGINPQDSNTWIARYMIDAKHQGKGYGKAGLKALIKFMETKYTTDSIFLDVSNDNIVATNLYVTAGFKETGRKNGESPIYKLDLVSYTENY